MIRDLIDSAIQMVKDRKRLEVEDEARRRAEERLLDALLPPPPAQSAPQAGGVIQLGPPAAAEAAEAPEGAGIIEVFNPAAEAVYGFKAEDEIGKKE